MKQIKPLIAGLTLLALLSPTVVFAAPRTLVEVEGVIRRIAAWFTNMFWFLAAVGIVFAAFLFLTSGGDEKKIEKAKKILLFAVFAILIAVFAPFAETLIRDILAPPRL